MGNDYFICKHCKGIECEGNGEESFLIEGYGDYRVCGDCVPDVKKMLVLPNPMKYHCFLENNMTNERKTFEDIEALKKWLGNKNPGDFKFGVYKKEIWEDHLKEAFIGERSCGGMSTEEVKEYARNLVKGGCGHITIGWRHVKPLFGFFLLGEQWEEDLFMAIRHHETKYNLGGKPLLAAREEELAVFCSPDQNEFIHWVDDLKTLEASFRDPNLVTDFRSVEEWKPSEEFVKYRSEYVNRKIERLTRKRTILEEIEGELKKAKKNVV
jgi:hypothetical protein